MSARRLVSCIALALVTSQASATMVATPIHGTTVGVSDGDTITILSSTRQEVRVRLAEIDAPEKSQPFGQASKASLSDLCYRKSTVIYPQDIDQYGRTIAHVVCEGQDANRTQVERGMAWVYERYAKQQSLFALQNAARAKHLGLWSDRDPQAPWEWRRERRN